MCLVQIEPILDGIKLSFQKYIVNLKQFNKTSKINLMYYKAKNQKAVRKNRLLKQIVLHRMNKLSQSDNLNIPKLAIMNMLRYSKSKIL